MNKLKKFIKTPKGKSIIIIVGGALLLLMTVFLITFINDPGEIIKEKKKLFDNRQQIEIKKAEAPGLDLKQYNGSFFTIDLPKGWKIETVGRYEKFGFKAYDPKNPEYAMFYYGKLEPFMKTQKAKDFMYNLSKLGGESYKLFGEAPVLSPATAKELFTIWPQIRTYSSKYGKEYQFMDLKNLKVIEELPYSTSMNASATNEGMIRAHYTNGKGTTNEGLFAATIVTPGSYYAAGVDTSFMMAYAVMGIMAPENEFLYLQKDLAKSLSSFKLSDSYIQEGIAQKNAETQAILNNIKQMSAAYESYNNAWRERQTTYDVISQKRSDATLGYDRVIDTTTGEIYKAEVGFYDTYKNNKSDYTNPNLELVTDNKDYLTPVDGYISK